MPAEVGILSAGLAGLKKAAIAVPIAWTGAWLAYYGIFCRLELKLSLYGYVEAVVYPREE
jgi:hypothetical protein